MNKETNVFQVIKIEEDFMDSKRLESLLSHKSEKNGVNKVAVILTILIQFFHGLIFVSYKYTGVSEGMHPFLILLYRGLFVLLFSLLWLRYEINELKFSKSHLHFLFYRAFASISILLSTMVAVQNGKLTTCEVIFRSASIIIVFLSHFTINEQIYTIDYVAMVVNSFCIIILVKPSFIFGKIVENKEDSLISIIAAFIYSFTFAFIRVFSKTIVEYFSFGIILTFNAVFNIIFAIISLYVFNINFFFNWKIFIIYLFVSVLDFAGQIFILTVSKLEKVNRVAPYNNVGLIFSSINSVLFFHGSFDFLDFIGISVMLIFFTYFSFKKQN